MQAFRVPILVALLLALACTDEPTTPPPDAEPKPVGRARLLVGEERATRTSIDFGAAYPTARVEREIWAVNDGDATVELAVPAIELPFRFEGAAAVTLAPGERVRWPVAFAPAVSGAFADELVIEVMGGDVDSVNVALSGTAKALPPGDPSCVRASAPDFAETVASCSRSRAAVRVSNVCEAPVPIYGLELVEGGDEFKVTRRPAFPHTLAVGGSFEIELEFATEQPGRYGLGLALQLGGHTIPVTAEAVAVEPTQRFLERFRGESRPKWDLLIVLDDSPSFASMRSHIERQLRSVALWLKYAWADVRVAVTTTSICSDPGSCTAEEANYANGRFLPLDESGPRVLSSEQPDFEEQLLSRLSVMGQGSERELLIRPAVLATSEPLRSGHNVGFLRDGAALSVFVLSDAADQDETPITELLAALEQAREVRRAGQLFFSGAIPAGFGQASQCSYDDPFAPQPARIRELAERTGGIVDEVCSDWARTIERFGGCNHCGLRTAFQLSRVPWKPEQTIVVTQGGQIVDRLDARGEVQWSWMPRFNMVGFEPLSLEPFADKTISYIACE